MLVVRGIVPPRGICIFPPPPSRTQYTSVQLPWSAPGVLQLSLMQRSSLSSTLSAVPIVHHQPVGFHIHQNLINETSSSKLSSSSLRWLCKYEKVPVAPSHSLRKVSKAHCR
uniref:Uncharacterized protein n=1 Tax=Parascaris univalens TaxID=6257 RepID=A0A915A3L4_PARUN